MGHKKTLQQQFSGITDDKNHKGYLIRLQNCKILPISAPKMFETTHPMKHSHEQTNMLMEMVINL